MGRYESIEAALSGGYKVILQQVRYVQMYLDELGG